MFPLEELRTLAGNKTALRRQVGRRRAQCVAAAARVALPFAWLDRALARWRRWSPFVRFAALPLGWLLARPFRRRRRRTRLLLRWAPLVVGVGRTLFAARRPAAGRE